MSAPTSRQQCWSAPSSGLAPRNLFTKLRSGMDPRSQLIQSSPAFPPGEFEEEIPVESISSEINLFLFFERGGPCLEQQCEWEPLARRFEPHACAAEELVSRRERAER